MSLFFLCCVLIASLPIPFAKRSHQQGSVGDVPVPVSRTYRWLLLGGDASDARLRETEAAERRVRELRHKVSTPHSILPLLAYNMYSVLLYHHRFGTGPTYARLGAYIKNDFKFGSSIREFGD